ncbi:MAG: hypothetical protein KIS78_36440 [Labilithrix sp.]|nr:hypothetical protein [Labilithrix sp.]MCW5837937.1 hypothetical protein [Labilithrix sp.]
MSLRAALGFTCAVVGLGGCTLLVSTSGLSGPDDVDAGDAAGAPSADGAFAEDGARDAGSGDAGDDVGADAGVEGVVWSQNGHRYLVRVYLRDVSWEAAKDDAVKAGGHLATITSAGEDAFVSALLGDVPTAFNDHYGPWIGAYQPAGDGGLEPAGGWAWVTGEPWAYTRWQDGEPNDGNGQEHYGHYLGGGWNDIELYGDGHVRSAVVEFE